MYTKPVPLKYGKLATKYPWIYEYFLQCGGGSSKQMLSNLRDIMGRDDGV